jgi:hypothetical protein
MKFLIDADVPRSVAKLLSSKAHDVLDIRDVTPFDVSDSVDLADVLANSVLLN